MLEHFSISETALKKTIIDSQTILELRERVMNERMALEALGQRMDYSSTESVSGF